MMMQEATRKVLSSNLGLAIQQLENSVNPAVNGHFLNQGRQQKESDGLHLSYTVPDIEGL